MYGHGQRCDLQAKIVFKSDLGGRKADWKSFKLAECLQRPEKFPTFLLETLKISLLQEHMLLIKRGIWSCAAHQEHNAT